MPPPSSGGVALVQLLNSVEPFPVHEMPHNSAEAVHLMVEAERRVYADRATHLGTLTSTRYRCKNYWNRSTAGIEWKAFSLIRQLPLRRLPLETLRQ